MIELKALKPAFNTPYVSTYTTSRSVGTTPKEYPIKELMRWIKRTPECIGIGKRLITDIFTNYYFVAIDKKNKSGRPSPNYKKDSEDEAVEFANSVLLKQRLFEAGLDWVFTGDAYIWTGVAENKIKEIADKYFKNSGMEMKEFKATDYLDEDNANKFEIIASTTVEIRYTPDSILGYTQQVNNITRQYPIDEVIHAKFMSLDGNPYGFTPMRSAGSVIQTMCNIKDYASYYFKNGGAPDLIFKLPKEMAGSPNFKLIEQTLEHYKELKHRHGNMLFAGEVEIERLNELKKDMEFRQLAIYFTGVLAFAFNMPADILSSILGTDIKGTATGSDIEDSGYKDNILNAQQYWEDLLNYQFFNKYFNVNIRFEKKFRQDQIRQSQLRTQNVAFAEFLFRHDYPITDEFIHDILQIPREYLIEGKIKREIEMSPTGISPFGNPKSSGQEQYSAKKRQEQKPQSNVNPPIGA